ncbi:MAG: Asp-tRNA(Asn)/Glu-tRNA(Gln) amidotransferase subunit GatC [bacterium]|nr:Asp-tRNA(Asn)/Glu-tRNA(Gln) amidotransferase subunit GatC [bacterium]
MQRLSKTKMFISSGEIEKISQLAKLKLGQSEKQELLRQLGDIIAYVEKINQLDLSQVPAADSADIEPVNLRQDKIEAGLTPQQALMNALAKNKGFFSVPKVIKK